MITKGFIFGAGASLSAGYPLASGMVNAIESFLSRLAQRRDCAELQRWCEETLMLMQRHNCATIDELAYVLRNENRGQAVLRAKAVMTALFFDLERPADLTLYRRAIRTMIEFDDLGLPLDGELEVPSSAFCITYNYDRCLEAAIYEEVMATGRRDGPNCDIRVQRLINSGINTSKKDFEPIDTTRFSILKMHGIVGTRHADWRNIDPVEGYQLETFGKVQLNDERLASFKSKHMRTSSTIIFFPWETDVSPWIERIISETDQAAVKFLTEVEELNIVGYSFHEQNNARLKSLLSRAQRCRVINLYNPSEESYSRLRSLMASLRLRVESIHYPNWNP